MELLIITEELSCKQEESPPKADGDVLISPINMKHLYNN